MKAFCIIAREKGNTYQGIQKASGISLSIISKTIHQAEDLGLVRHFDNRKLPRMVKLLNCRRRLAKLLSLMKAWEAWIFSDEGEPP
jgi:DNA-binding HxlR family transcriptional regulator